MKVTTFPVTSFVGGSSVKIYPTLLQFNDKNYLVDCGYEESFGELARQRQHIGVTPTDIHAILISHDHIDHLGALRLFEEANPSLLVYCGSIEVDSVARNVKLERLAQAESSLLQLLDTHKEWAQGLIDDLKSIKRVPVDDVLHDNLRIDQEVQVISTPGHTKGHISFYVPAQRILIANDAVVFNDNQLDIANPQFTLDLKQAIKSVEKLSEFPINRLICYHGSILDTAVQLQLSSLLTRHSTYL
jgi:glyoxylase-like metal-dependent hydrolase (beta-lactamase superfamily II)